MSLHSSLDFSWSCEPTLVAVALHQHGCAVVRGAISVDALDSISKAVDTIYRHYDDLKQKRELPPKLAWTFKFGVLSALEVLKTHEAEVNFVRQHGKHESIQAIAGAYFQSPLLVELPRIVFRRQSPDNRNREIPYHQDFYTQTQGVSGVLNFWTPFVDCGVEAPSLEVVTHVFDDLLPTRPAPLMPENEAFDKINITRDQIVSYCGADKFWHPPLSAGDVLIFTDHVVHRTYITEQMSKERQSMEYRVISERSILPSYRDSRSRFIGI